MKKLKLGTIEFINSLPVSLGLISGQVTAEVEIISGVPTDLNKKLMNREIEVSPVSAFWYAENQRDLLLLPDLSISSESGVQSVLLFSRLKFKELRNACVALTGKGRTTPVLLEILCQERLGFTPKLKFVENELDTIPADADAMLLIGDEALRMKEELKNSDVEIIDLAEEWKRWTGLPFVFAVWAVRKDTYSENADAVHEIHEVLLKSKQWGLTHLDLVTQEAMKKSRLSEGVVRSYFEKLSYDFSQNLKEGMKRFFTYAVKGGLLKSIGEFQEIDGHKPALAGQRER
jgi:chorismate dehydratase